MLMFWIPAWVRHAAGAGRPVLPTGRRRGRCPQEMLGVPLPRTACWTLLRSGRSAAAEQQTEQVSGSGDGA
jgi:hypothetical protein